MREETFLPKLFTLIDNKKKAVRREACWTLSNITAGNPHQIETIMGVPQYVEKIINIAMKDIPEVIVYYKKVKLNLKLGEKRSCLDFVKCNKEQ